MYAHFSLKVLDEVDIFFTALEVTDDGFSPGDGYDDSGLSETEVLDLILEHFLFLNGELFEHVPMTFYLLS